MMNLPQVAVTAKIYESANSLVYRGIRQGDGTPVILKVLKEDYPTPAELTRYKQEYEITRSLNIEGVIKAYSQQDYQRSLMMLLEDFGGESLAKWMQESPQAYCPVPLAQFLSLAIKITEILGRIHAANIIHKDINPGNIVLNPNTGVVKIIDFGISTQLTGTNPTFKNPNVLEGTLAYISPEQTGRMNRILDYRTDFYSLGVTFYELLTGQLPFTSTDILELVHCHLAKQPTPPHQVNAQIPRVVSGMIMKLMAKNAEQRYQSAWGLKADLSECLRHLETTGKIATFGLGNQDISDKFQIPQKLYGREAEVETLITAFERLATGKAKGSELLLVAGYSGIGKSALVQEIYRPITEKRGYFLSGKFDQLQRNIPYSAVVSAFAGLVRQMLSEPEDQLQQWHNKLLTALGTNGQIIINVIPEVELIIGKQPPVADVGATEALNRFNLVFQKFIRVFCSKEHPLVIFLDDLQWADSATLKLIELMMIDADTQCLFLVGAYRDNEVNPTHPLMMMLEGLTKEGATISRITLAPLGLEAIAQLIADTLHSEISTVKPLAELVLWKTGGNPFFANEFLKMLYTESLLTFDFEHLSWRWDIAQIEDKNITDNVVALMIGKLNKIPYTTQQILKIAACIGAEFDLTTLSIISEKTPEEVFPELVIAAQSGLILTISELDEQLLIQNYKFLHDRVQQAAYALIAEEQQQPVHLQIGYLLLQSGEPETIHHNLFKVVDHLNLGRNLVTEQQERDKVSRLNLIAGQKAKKASAPIAALQYLTIGIELLAANSWQFQYALTLILHEEATEAAYLGGDFQQMEQWALVVLKYAKTVLDKIKVYETKIQTCMAQGRQKEAIKIGLEVLELLDIILPETPTEIDVQRQLEETAEYFNAINIKDLLGLPFMREQNKLAAMRILSSLVGATFQAAPTLLPLIVLEQINLSVRYGNTSFSTFAYAAYGGLILNGVMRDFEGAYQFGKLALSLTERLDSKELRCKVLEMVGAHNMHCKEHIRQTLPLLQEAYETGLETGDLEFGVYSAVFKCLFSHFAGLELTKVESEIKGYSDILTQMKQQNILNYLCRLQQFIYNLTEQVENPVYLLGSHYNEDQFLPIHIEANDRSHLYYVYLYKLILSYLFEGGSQAVKYASQAELYLDGVLGTFSTPVFYFYDSLVQMQLYQSIPSLERDDLLLKIIINQKKMQEWSCHAPTNFQHKYDLVEAEKARVSGNLFEAEEFYEQAIIGARDNEYLQEEALAYELAAKHYLARGREKFAQLYMKEAHYCYELWGATAKVKDLEIKYPQLLTQSPAVTCTTSTRTTNSTTITGASSGEALDLATVMKATQAIASEILLERLLGSLMQILIENAGAQTGFLILNKEGQWVIEASGILNSDAGDDTHIAEVLQSVPIRDRLSVSIVNYVVRTKESVVISDAALESDFATDSYIKTYQTKSILCAPLINQGDLVGIVYLENNLAVGAFTQNRVEVLQLLSGQAAIAITNAKLYAERQQAEKLLADYNRTLEEQVAARTLELEREIAERKRAEEAAQAANRAKSIFLANMSHELRTPLNAIIGFSQLMNRSSTLPSEHQENLDIITCSGEHLLTLINQVLDLSKIEAGRTTLNETKFNLHRLLRDLKDMFQLKAKNKGLELLFDLYSDVPRYIHTDEVKLRQVLINLLNNAIKFTSKGSVSLKVKNESEQQTTNNIDAQAASRRLQQTTITFEVEDTGAGIASDELDNLFEAFMQTKTGQQAQEGTGLGLTITRSFVQLMGGEMTVSSYVGKGTTFKFDIQATVVESIDSKSQQPTRRAIALEPNQPHYRILIVDDLWDNRQLLIKLLSPLGFELQEASNGQEGIAIWDAWEPHLIWMDIRMPVMDGIEATQRIKATPKGQHTVIVALTASVLEEKRTTILAAGCAEFIRKPFREADIFDAMHKHIGVRFVYEQPAAIPTSTETKVDVLTSAALAALPSDLVVNLRQAILSLDIESMQSYIAQISELDQPLAEAIATLVKDFKYKQLLTLTQPTTD